MAEKVTVMKLKVDLQCHKCYKKVKKVLSKFPQIRDQAYDDKQNIVFIKVVCCDPERLRDKICCKAGGAIKSIEIVEPPKPKPADKPKEKPPEKPADKPKEKPADKPKEKPADKPKEKPAESDEAKGTPKTPNPAPPVLIPVPPPVAVPIGVCCGPCYEGRPGGPCFHGYGEPTIVYDGYYGRPVFDSYGGGRPYYVSRCDQYFSDENPSGCSIM